MVQSGLLRSTAHGVNMEFFMDDKRDYSNVIQSWLEEFRATMDPDPSGGISVQGDDSGDTFPGVKIIFDGYAELDDGQPDLKTESYAVFVHKESLRNKHFPEHEVFPTSFGSWIIHRPDEEVCIYAWYSSDDARWDVIPFEDNNGTNMKPHVISDLIFKIHKAYTE